MNGPLYGVVGDVTGIWGLSLALVPSCGPFGIETTKFDAEPLDRTWSVAVPPGAEMIRWLGASMYAVPSGPLNEAPLQNSSRSSCMSPTAPSPGIETVASLDELPLVVSQ